MPGKSTKIHQNPGLEYQESSRFSRRRHNLSGRRSRGGRGVRGRTSGNMPLSPPRPHVQRSCDIRFARCHVIPSFAAGFVEPTTAPRRFL